LGGRKIWYDEVVGRLNVDERGRLLGAFDGEDAILCIYKDGSYELTSYELTNRYEPDQLLLLQKWDPKRPITALHYVPANQAWYVKRFVVETSTLNKRFLFIAEDKGAKLAFIDYRDDLLVQLTTGTKKKSETQEVNLSQFIDVKGWKAMGNKLTTEPLLEVKLLSATEPVIAVAEPKPERAEEEEEEVADAAELADNDAAEADNAPESNASGTSEGSIDIGTTIEFDVKKEREQKGGDSPQQLNLF
jgi:topoisomerase-4 subunit A